MSKEKVIEGLIEFRTILECCFEDSPDCENCPVSEACLRFCENNCMHAIDILDGAIEMLREDANKE